MRSINVYDVVQGIEANEEPIKENQHFLVKQVVNETEEELNTWIFMNEVSPSGYRNYRVVSDEVTDMRVRVHGQEVDQVIKQNVYSVYYHPVHKRLVTLCRKDESLRVIGLFEDKFDIKLEKHKFNIPEIIAQSTDVRGARFDVQIETVRGISIRGSSVNNTQYYSNMIASGELAGVVVSFDYDDKNVTFRVLTDGSLFFWTEFSEHGYLDFIDLLYRY